MATFKGSEQVTSNILKQVKRAAKLVQILAIVTLVLSLTPLVIGGICASILYFKLDWGYWSWILYTACCVLPACVGLVFWYGFYTLGGSPESAEEIAKRLKERFPKYSQGFKLKKYGGGKKIRLSLRLCWDVFMVTGNIDDIVFAGVVVGYAATPFGWITAVVLAAWGVIGTVIILISTIWMLFF